MVLGRVKNTHTCAPGFSLHFSLKVFARVQSSKLLNCDVSKGGIPASVAIDKNFPIVENQFKNSIPLEGMQANSQT